MRKPGAKNRPAEEIQQEFAAITTLVEQEPGLTAAQLLKRLQLDPIHGANSIRKLFAAGRIVSQGTGLRRRYYPPASVCVLFTDNSVRFERGSSSVTVPVPEEVRPFFQSLCKVRDLVATSM